MDLETPIVLVVAHKTAAAATSGRRSRERARRGAVRVTLPSQTQPAACTDRRPRGQGPGEANAVIDHALPLLSEAAGRRSRESWAPPTRALRCTMRSPVRLRQGDHLNTAYTTVAVVEARPSEQGVGHGSARDHRDPLRRVGNINPHLSRFRGRASPSAGVSRANAWDGEQQPSGAWPLRFLFAPRSSFQALYRTYEVDGMAVSPPPPPPSPRPSTPAQGIGADPAGPLSPPPAPRPLRAVEAVAAPSDGSLPDPPPPRARR